MSNLANPLRDGAYLMWGLTALNVCVNAPDVSLIGSGASILIGAALHPEARGGIRRVCARILRQIL
jgi:hypothetical protein